MRRFLGPLSLMATAQDFQVTLYRLYISAMFHVSHFNSVSSLFSKWICFNWPTVQGWGGVGKSLLQNAIWLSSIKTCASESHSMQLVSITLSSYWPPKCPTVYPAENYCMLVQESSQRQKTFPSETTIYFLKV